MERKTDGQIDREKERHKGRYTERQIDRETERLKDVMGKTIRRKEQRDKDRDIRLG